MNKQARVGLFILIALSIFVYLSINIRAWNPFSASYAAYYVTFDDVIGLEQKAQIKIAGISVGWVDDVSITEVGDAVVTLRIKREHKLYKLATATITQEGLLGARILEINPGDSREGPLLPGSRLLVRGTARATLRDIVEQGKEIAEAVQETVQSFSRVFSSQSGEQKMSDTLTNVWDASSSARQATTSVAEIIKGNKDSIDRSIERVEATANAAVKVAPMIEDVVGQIHQASGKVIEDVKKTTGNAVQVSDSVKNIGRKIESGQGTVGKLVYNDDLYNSAKNAIDNIGQITDVAKKLEIIVDASWYRNYRITNSRGEVSLRLRHLDDYFYIFQLSSDQYGKIRRTQKMADYLDKNGTPIVLNTSIKDPSNAFNFAWMAPLYMESHLDLMGTKLGFQVGKRFDRITLRGGLFEDAVGFGLDFDVPLRSNTVKWRMTIEAFDFAGLSSPFLRPTERDRVRVRWINRISIFKNIYTCVGLDDMFSKNRASPFFGAGLYFNDDDLKYLMFMMGSRLGGGR